MRSGNMQRKPQLRIALALVFILTLLPTGLALADPSFVNDGFKAKWQRADKPVADGVSNPARSWLWGPEGFTPPNGVTTEPYTDSPGGQRSVQYFDKARMELNNPTTGLVTNGLLVRELISGKLATSDATSTPRRPADDIPVAGDPTGNNGPTYASFAKIASLEGNNPAPDRTGQAASDTIDKNGTVGSSPDLGGKAKYVYFDSGLKHNVPDVFWTFMNQKGNIYANGQFASNQPVLGDNANAPWLDANGLPITDAYWAKVTVGGQAKDVLIQAFERRVLTYTPDNDPAFRVEMGNVGRHYFSWRYNTKYDAPGGGGDAGGGNPAPTGCNAIPASKGGAYPFLQCGPAGMVINAVAPMGASESVIIKVTFPDGSSGSATRTSQPDGNVLIAVATMPAEQGVLKVEFTGQTSNKKAETYVRLTAPVDKPTLIVFPNPGRLDQDITVVAVGFSPSTNFITGARAPDPNSPTLQTGVVKTSPGGGFTTRLIPRNIFTGDNAKFLQPGDWVIVGIGADGKEASAIVNLTK